MYIIPYLRTASPYILQKITYRLYVIMNSDFFKKLGINIKKKRNAIGLSQQELADKTGISLNFIGKIEVAFSKPSLDTVIKIADALEISVSELCNFK